MVSMGVDINLYNVDTKENKFKTIGSYLSLQNFRVKCILATINTLNIKYNDTDIKDDGNDDNIDKKLEMININKCISILKSLLDLNQNIKYELFSSSILETFRDIDISGIYWWINHSDFNGNWDKKQIYDINKWLLFIENNFPINDDHNLLFNNIREIFNEAIKINCTLSFC